MSIRHPHNPAQSFTEHQQDAPPLANYEAEMALLAAILTRNDIWFKAAEIVGAEHFADALHGRIFDAIGRLVQAGQIANAVTLKPIFDGDGALAGHGGGRYLAKLSASVVTLVGAEDYAGAIRDLWLRRALVASAEAIRADAANLDRPPDETTAVTIRDLTALSGEGRQTAIGKRAVAESLVDRIMRPGACFSTGIGALDDAIGGGLYEGKLLGIAARKKVGKTVLLGTVSHNLNRADIRHLFIALEMSPTEIEQRNASRELGINPMAFLRNPTKDLARQVADYSGGVGDATIYESAPGASLDEVRRMIGRAIVRHRIKGVILDYWQLVGGKARNESEEYHLRNVAQWLADTCRKHNIWALVAAQVNQEGNTRGGEGLKLACDVYFTLHRDKGSDGAWLEMEESRYVPYRNIGNTEVPGLWLHHSGPYFDEAPPPVEPAKARST